MCQKSKTRLKDKIDKTGQADIHVRRQHLVQSIKHRDTGFNQREAQTRATRLHTDSLKALGSHVRQTDDDNSG